MTRNKSNTNNPRRQFLGAIANGAAFAGLSVIASPLAAHAENHFSIDHSISDDWFKQIKGKHRILFDVPGPHELFPFAWPRIFLVTNAVTGTPEKDCSVVVVLRHAAIPYAMEDRLWAKYNLGEVFKANDPKTKKPSLRNPFWKPQHGDFNIPGIGVVPIGINELQQSGVLFCVCNMALTVNSAVVAKAMNLDATEVLKDWVDGLLPGIQVMPSGLWAINRAQERGCSYCFVG